MDTSDAQVAAHALALERAAVDREPIAPLSSLDPALDVERAYAIQRRNVEQRIAAGARIRGRKIGLTSRPMQELLGVDEPDFGVLLDDMLLEDGAVVDLARLLQPKVEAEIAFVLGAPLRGPGVTAASAAVAVAGVLPALEIIDSRVRDWRIALVDTIADNASSGLAVLGGRMLPLEALDVRLVGMALTRNGELLDTGAGAAALGDPLACVAWLANKLAAFGEQLEAGDVVLSGALHAAREATAGDVFHADFASLGPVGCRFVDSADPAAGHGAEGSSR